MIVIIIAPLQYHLHYHLFQNNEAYATNTSFERIILNGVEKSFKKDQRNVF